jgi:hypothetical protein
MLFLFTLVLFFSWLKKEIENRRHCRQCASAAKWRGLLFCLLCGGKEMAAVVTSFHWFTSELKRLIYPLTHGNKSGFPQDRMTSDHVGVGHTTHAADVDFHYNHSMNVSLPRQFWILRLYFPDQSRLYQFGPRPQAWALR